MDVASILFAIGGTTFMLLGVLHGAYTLADLRQPRRLAPSDPTLTAAMRFAMAAVLG